MGKTGDSFLSKLKAAFAVKKISITGFLKVILFFSGVFTLGGFLSRYAWCFDVLSHFRIQYFVFLFIISLISLLMRKWKVLLISAVLCFVNLIQLLPFYLPYASADISQYNNAKDVKVMLLNVLTSNGEYNNVLRYIDEKNPDIVLLEEVNKSWINALSLSDKFEYSVVRTREDNFGVALYSNIKLEKPRIEYFGDAHLPSAAEIRVGDTEVSILGTHPLNPSGDLSFRLRNNQFESIVKNRNKFSDSMILLGDLNTTSWSYGFKSLIEGMNLYDTRMGRGVQISWPTTIPLISIPIDHCLVSKDIKVLKREVGPNLGSDHRPVYIELRIPGNTDTVEEETLNEVDDSNSGKTSGNDVDPGEEYVGESLINTAGSTIKERFRVPHGFERVPATQGSYAEYLRNLPLKPHGSEVMYFDGREKGMDVHEAVIDIDVGERDLQQCADAVMRLRAEYLYGKELYDKIHFNFTNGFKADYPTWMNGNRIVVKGNDSYWVKRSGYSKDYNSFRQYMDMVFAYAGTLSLSKELNKVSVEEMQIGDVFMKGDLPGHCVVVVDMAVNRDTGEKLFMIAQSYMPAQDIHVLKNYNDKGISPWYSSNFDRVLETPQWTFFKDQLMRFDE